jgi:cytochrome c oxidase cbb3-type subunit III
LNSKSILLFALSLSLIATAQADSFTVAKGAELYVKRCMLCHGAQGMGEGMMAISIQDYPSTNLLVDVKAVEVKDIVHAISKGGSMGEMSVLMPPWEIELTQEQIFSLVDLILFLRTNTESALALLNEERQKIPASLKVGELVYDKFCVICHGSEGLGHGRLAGKLIKNPLPTDFSKKKRSYDFLYRSIANGGEGVDRSEQMPPWRDQLTNREIESLIIYINDIYRKNAILDIRIND